MHIRRWECAFLHALSEVHLARCCCCWTNRFPVPKYGEIAPSRVSPAPKYGNVVPCRVSSAPKCNQKGSKVASTSFQDTPRFVFPLNVDPINPKKSLKTNEGNRGFQLLSNFNRRHMRYHSLLPTWTYVDVKIRPRRAQIASRTP